MELSIPTTLSFRAELEKISAQRVRGYTRKDGTRVKGHTRGNPSTSSHVGKRTKERAPGTEAEVDQLRRKIPSLKLRRGETYFYELSNGSYAIIGDVGKKNRHHVVKTILGRYMKPPGMPIGRVLKD